MFILSWIDSCSKVAECFSSFMGNTFYDVLRIRWDVHTGTSKKINHYTKYRVFLIIFLGVIVFSVMILGILCTQLDPWFLFLSVFVLLCLFSAFNSLGRVGLSGTLVSPGLRHSSWTPEPWFSFLPRVGMSSQCEVWVKDQQDQS